MMVKLALIAFLMVISTHRFGQITEQTWFWWNDTTFSPPVPGNLAWNHPHWQMHTGMRVRVKGLWQWPSILCAMCTVGSSIQMQPRWMTRTFLVLNSCGQIRLQACNLLPLSQIWLNNLSPCMQGGKRKPRSFDTRDVRQVILYASLCIVLTIY